MAPPYIRNKRVYRYLENYSRAAFDLLRRASEMNPPVGATTKVVRGTSPNSRQYTQIARIEWVIIETRNQSILIQLPERQIAIDAIRRSPVFRKHLDTLVGTVGWSFRITTDEILRSIPLDLLYRGFKEFPAAEFRKCYAELEHYFYSNSIHLRFVAPLEHFEMGSKRIDLGGGLAIIRLGDKEFTDLYSRDSIFPYFSQMHESDFALVYETDVSKKIGDRSGSSPEKHPQVLATTNLDKALILLRLFKSGNVDYRLVHQLAGKFTFHAGGMVFSQGGKSEIKIGGSYTLSKREASTFLHFWRAYQNYTKVQNTSLDVAVRRFGFGYNRVQIEDRFIDYLIGFEALFFTKSEKQELAFKLALRVAALLGNTGRKRQTIYRKMKKAYTLRSEMVHGEPVRKAFQLDSGDYTLDALTKDIEEFLRLSILRYFVLLKTNSISKIVENLDGMITRR